MILKEGRGTRGGAGEGWGSGHCRQLLRLSELLLRVSTVYIFGPVFLPSFHFLGNGVPQREERDFLRAAGGPLSPLRVHLPDKETEEIEVTGQGNCVCRLHPVPLKFQCSTFLSILNICGVVTD